MRKVKLNEAQLRRLVRGMLKENQRFAREDSYGPFTGFGGPEKISYPQGSKIDEDILRTVLEFMDLNFDPEMFERLNEEVQRCEAIANESSVEGADEVWEMGKHLPEIIAQAKKLDESLKKIWSPLISYSKEVY